jgi:hypothetical protein
MFPAGLPLLIVPFALCNILALVVKLPWNREIWHFRMASEGDWGLTLGDAIVAGAIIILLIEMLRAARRASRRSILDHVRSMILFVVMLVEFLTVKAVASSTFFLLLVVSFVDVAAGFSVSIRSAPRDVLVDNAGGGAGP